MHTYDTSIQQQQIKTKTIRSSATLSAILPFCVNNNNNRGHFYSAVSHRQGCAHRALEDQRYIKTSKIIIIYIVLIL